MGIKVIAIGSRIMGDDGIAVYIADELKKTIKNENIEIIIGETDFNYCLDAIEPEDKLVIIDSACVGAEPGTVSVIPYEQYFKQPWEAAGTQHEASLLKQLRFYHDVKKVTLLAVEVRDIQIRLGLSEVLKSRFQNILTEVREILLKEFFVP